MNKVKLNPTLNSTAILLLLLAINPSQAYDFSGRVSVSSSIAHPQSGDVALPGEDWITTDQESLRLMLNGGQDKRAWSVHLKTSRQHYQGVFPVGLHSSDFFRYKTLSSDWVEDSDTDSSTYIGAEIDRATFKYSADKFSLTAGRQAVDWGVGRLWQPMNVFGAFAPTDLDTEYKPGIDALTLDWFPSPFSSLTVAYVLSPDDDIAATKNSAVIHYRRLVGEQTELSLLAGDVSGDPVFGASIEGEKNSIGLRLEATHHDLPLIDDKGLFIIAGADYKFANGILLITELYYNHFGSSNVNGLSDAQNGWLLNRGLQPHLSRNVVGVSLQKELSPLLSGSYALLTSQLSSDTGDKEYSFLHQLGLKYSLSDESDLLFSLQTGVGKGRNQQGTLRSEFGHIPTSIAVRWSRYF